jgi:hypothetical protein
MTRLAPIAPLLALLAVAPAQGRMLAGIEQPDTFPSSRRSSST